MMRSWKHRTLKTVAVVSTIASCAASASNLFSAVIKRKAREFSDLLRDIFRIAGGVLITCSNGSTAERQFTLNEPVNFLSF